MKPLIVKRNEKGLCAHGSCSAQPTDQRFIVTIDGSRVEAHYCRRHADILSNVLDLAFIDAAEPAADPDVPAG